MSKRITHLTVFYDDQCGMCINLMKRFRLMPTYFSLSFVRLHSPETQKKFPKIIETYGRENFLALDNNGGLYLNTEARIMVLYATRAHRGLAMKLKTPAMFYLADTVFEAVSKRRKKISALFFNEKDILSRAKKTRASRGPISDKSTCKV